MKQQQLHKMTPDQAIDAVYQLFGEQRQPLTLTQVGEYGISNPGPKEIDTLTEKLDRKTRTKKESELNLPREEVLANHLTGNEAKSFDMISDYCRAAYTVPNFKAAMPLLAALLAEVGGEITIHQRPDYKAIHLHTTLNNINCEIQFHTPKTLELKQATDIFYHNYRNVKIPKNSKIEEDYLAEREQMTQYCDVVYRNTDFDAIVPMVADLQKAYHQKTHGHHPRPNKLKHFLMLVRKAEVVQQELIDKMHRVATTLVQEYDQQRN